MPLAGFTIRNLGDIFNVSQAQVDDEDWSIIVAGFQRNGVVSGCEVTAQGTPDATVAVASGTAIVAGVEVAVAGGNVNVLSGTGGQAADSSNPRFTLITVDAAGVLGAVHGTAQAAPVFPDHPTGGGAPTVAVLASIFVPQSVTTVLSTYIQPKRLILYSPGLFDQQRVALQNARKHLLLAAPDGDDVDGIIIKRPTNTYGVGHTANLLSVIREGANPGDINSAVIAHFNEWGGGGAQTWHVRPGVNQPTLTSDYDISNVALWVEVSVDCVNLILDKAAGLTPTQDFLKVRDEDVDTYLSIDKEGYLLIKKTAAPADASIDASELNLWLDDNLVSPRIMFKSKDSGGNPKTNYLPASTPLRHFESHAISGGATLKDLGYPLTITSPGIAAAGADDVDGAWIVVTTAASTGAVAGFTPTDTLQGFYRDWYPDFWMRMRTAASVANCRIWAGLFASDPSGSADPAIHGAGFRRDTGAGDTNWQAWSNDGTSGGTLTDTGVAGAASTAYRFRIVFGLNKIDFFLNGKLVASHTTNLPALLTRLLPYEQMTTLNATAKSVRFGAMAVGCV